MCTLKAGEGCTQRASSLGRRRVLLGRQAVAQSEGERAEVPHHALRLIQLHRQRQDQDASRRRPEHRPPVGGVFGVAGRKGGAVPILMEG